MECWAHNVSSLSSSSAHAMFKCQTFPTSSLSSPPHTTLPHHLRSQPSALHYLKPVHHHQNARCLKCGASPPPATAKATQDLRLSTDIPIAIESVPIDDRQLPIVVADCDAVMQMYIDAGQGDRDPYWTTLWPSSIALAQELLKRPELVAGKRVADFGAGLGLGGLAAALAGASEVVFLDREPLALQCCLLNAVLCGLPGVELDEETVAVALRIVEQGKGPQHLLKNLSSAADSFFASKNESSGQQQNQVIRAETFDWYQPITNLKSYFDVVVACDVLYERTSVEPVAAVAPQLLRPGGDSTILLADPPSRAKQNRVQFLELLALADGFMAVECGQRRANVWEHSQQKNVEVPIEFMILQQGCSGDTIGVKFYTD